MNRTPSFSVTASSGSTSGQGRPKTKPTPSATRHRSNSSPPVMSLIKSSSARPLAVENFTEARRRGLSSRFRTLRLDPPQPQAGQQGRDPVAWSAEIGAVFAQADVLGPFSEALEKIDNSEQTS